MITRYYNYIKSKVQIAFGKDWLSQLNKAEKEIRNSEHKIQSRQLRVLIGPSFAIYPPSFALDRAISLALRIRGCDVVPIYCDSIQKEECNYIGGDWGGKEKFQANCTKCKQTSEQLWQHGLNKPIPLSRYLSAEDIEKVRSIVTELDFDAAKNYQVDGIAYGIMAKDILVNNYLVATPTLIENHEHLIKVHLQNLLIVSLAYERILDQHKPDRVVSNDSYYGMWAILERLCRARAIPFYSHWPVNNSRSAFAYNDAAMNLDFTKSWANFSKIVLAESDEKQIEKWLTGNRGYFIDTTKLAGHECDEPVLNTIDPSKPTLILAANVIWDLAALNKQILFKDMAEWIIETINWFASKENYQLIIRPHPVETSPKIPKTKETVFAVIESSGVRLPENVFLLKSDAKVTFNELILKYNVRGVAVHTTTVGFEYPALGLPVVTTAKSPYRGFGFTIDPTSTEEYFIVIRDLLTGERKSVSDQSKELAKKFIKFNHFHYYANTGLFVGNPPVIAENFKEILKQEKGPFNYVINSIVEGLPINSTDRWIAES
jgi:hypothetical protein